jgi:hypothetical protein
MLPSSLWRDWLEKKLLTGILQLNLCLFLPILIAWTNGLDGSLVNSLQLLPDWQEFFGEPTGVMVSCAVWAVFLSTLEAEKW